MVKKLLSVFAMVDVSDVSTKILTLTAKLNGCYSISQCNNDNCQWQWAGFTDKLHEVELGCYQNGQ